MEPLAGRSCPRSPGGGDDSTPPVVSPEALRISARRAQLEQRKIVREEEEVEEAEKLASIKESFE